MSDVDDKSLAVTDSKPPIIVAPLETSGHLNATIIQKACDAGMHILKNPKWVLEWMLVVFILKLILTEHLTLAAIMKLLKG